MYFNREVFKIKLKRLKNYKCYKILAHAVAIPNRVENSDTQNERLKQQKECRQILSPKKF